MPKAPACPYGCTVVCLSLVHCLQYRMAEVRRDEGLWLNSGKATTRMCYGQPHSTQWTICRVTHQPGAMWAPGQGLACVATPWRI